jgi:hypothetical protein
LNWGEFVEFVDRNAPPWRLSAIRQWIDAQSMDNSRPGGRKTAVETLKEEILSAFERKQLTCKRGELSGIASELQQEFPSYKTDSIRKMIQDSYRERCGKTVRSPR